MFVKTTLLISQLLFSSSAIAGMNVWTKLKFFKTKSKEIFATESRVELRANNNDGWKEDRRSVSARKVVAPEIWTFSKKKNFVSFLQKESSVFLRLISRSDRLEDSAPKSEWCPPNISPCKVERRCARVCRKNRQANFCKDRWKSDVFHNFAVNFVKFFGFSEIWVTRKFSRFRWGIQKNHLETQRFHVNVNERIMVPVLSMDVLL